MNIIDALLGEHAALLTVFDHVQRFQSGWQLPQFGETCLLLESLLATHAILEDELLFDPITPDRGRFAETLRLMREEHDELRRLVGDLKHADTVPDSRRLLNRLIEVAREHFAVEERVLFSMAAEVIGAPRLQKLGEEWALRRHLSFAV